MTSRVKVIDLQEADLDRPLYRIYPVWLFEMALSINGGNLTLVRPALWEDPQEDLCAWLQMDARGGSQKQLSGYLRPTYAQCWSMDGQSDALSRAYSRVSKDPVSGRNVEPKLEGVKARTTPRLVIDALEKSLRKRGDDALELFVAKIAYVDSPGQEILDRLVKVGPTRLGAGSDRAWSLTLKRKAFGHEQEVRIIAVARPDTNANIIQLDINPNDVFQDVSFDPRLLAAERNEREARVRALGYTGPVTIDWSYSRTLVDAVLPRHWDELDANARQEAEARSAEPSASTTKRLLRPPWE